MEPSGFFTSFKTEIFNLAKQGKDEFDDWFKIGLSDYIEDRNEKFRLTNTFYSPYDKLNFYDVFFPINLSFNKKTLSSENVLDTLFTANKAVSLIGNIGSGKTMLIKHVFLSTYNHFFKIPIFIELRDLNHTSDSITDYIYKTILKNKIKPSNKILERTLKLGDFLFILDGYDELYSARKEVITKEIEEFIDVNNKNYFLISSRPHCGLESLSRLNNFYINPLKPDEIERFMVQQLEFQGNRTLLSKIKIALDKPENKAYHSYLSNPLLLSMFLVVFNKYPELPKSQNKFYWNVFETLSIKHDSLTKKGGYLHERRSGLLNEDIEKVLKIFAYKSLFESKYAFDEQYLKEKLKEIKTSLNLNCKVEDLIYDFQNSISVLWNDGLDIYFPHTTLQDYFAASYIKDLDNNAKFKVYTEKLFRLSKMTVSLDSLWQLCKELDKESFYDYFLITTIKNFLSQYSHSPTKTPELDFLNNLKFEVLIEVVDNKEIILNQSGALENIVAVNIAKFLGYNFLDKIDITNLNTHLLPQLINDNKNQDFIVTMDISPANNPMYLLKYYTNGLSATPFLDQMEIIEKTKELFKFLEESISKLSQEISEDNYTKNW